MQRALSVRCSHSSAPRRKGTGRLHSASALDNDTTARCGAMVTLGACSDKEQQHHRLCLTSQTDQTFLATAPGEAKRLSVAQDALSRGIEAQCGHVDQQAGAPERGRQRERARGESSPRKPRSKNGFREERGPGAERNTNKDAPAYNIYEPE